VAGYVPSADADGYESVQIMRTVSVDVPLPFASSREPGLWVEFHDYGHPDIVHSILLTLGEEDDEDDQFVGWDFDATLEELAQAGRIYSRQ
jgi:hypothetical protein